MFVKTVISGIKSLFSRVKSLSTNKPMVCEERTYGLWGKTYGLRGKDLWFTKEKAMFFPGKDTSRLRYSGAVLIYTKILVSISTLILTAGI